MRLKRWLIACCALALAACGGATAPAPTGPVTVRLPVAYIAHVQFAPFYVAVERGYFARENIAIEFDYKFETDGVKLVAANALPFALASGEQVVLARAQGLPVTYVLQWYCTYPIAVFAPTSLGLRSAADLKGKRVGLPGLFGATYVGWRAWLAQEGVRESDVRQEVIGFTQREAVQQGRVDAAVGYANNEPVALAASGFPVDVIVLGERVPLVGNGLITNETVLRDNPALVRGMTRAILAGVRDSLADPDAAMRIAARHVEGLSADDPVQRKVLQASLALMQAPGCPGPTSPAHWASTQAALIEMGQLDRALDPTTFYSNDYLP